MRRAAVWIIVFVAGLFYLLEFLLPAEMPAALGGFENPLTALLPNVTRLIIVVAAMAFLLGPINLIRSHIGALVRGREGRGGSIVFLVCLAVGIFTKACYETEFGKDIRLNVLHDALIYGLATAFFASSMALLAFYLVSAAHRAFRLSSVDAGVMMIAAVIVLLGQVPIGDWITYRLPALKLRTWSQWILMYPNAGVQRAVLIGACAGALAASTRHWLGLGRRTN